MLITLLAYLPFFVIALVAQWSDRYEPARRLTFGLLLLVDGLVALAGLVAIATSMLAVPEILVFAGEPDLLAFGLGLLATAAAAPVLLIARVRRALARLIPIDPASGVHATALVLAVLMVGLNLSQLPFIGGLEAIANSTIQFEFLELLLPLLPIGLFALVGVGYLIRRDGPQTRRRLGIERLSGRDVALSVGLAEGIVVVYYGVDWVWRTLAPENYALMEAVGEVLYGGVIAPWQGILISLTAAVTEELLFRGAVQPRFGILLTALLFTAAHVQYGFTPATLEILVAALVLGWLRRRTNTSACVLLHFLYDALALVVFPLLP